QSGGSDRRDDLKKGCWYCRHGNGSNIVGDDAICTAGLDSGKRCNYGYDQTQCPYYKPYC
ncbi:MAG: hypothetical protein K2J28_03540, partial [Duncaniella sp.]|nr:hypothetical protein [Duncaniella sp.]